ncbi:ABC transporter ATP-binding protein [Pseudorhodoplanes sinuspersici]|uniref:ABC transporter ATP-binding protein n=1 Tax=Pseudorhodoplanes sinuspersici TaxID=1235591 RepID=A0A1W7A0S8_9HYPH|nr:ABC transporter ATP-binding protein [Pseudorhodoplanes sinuspersici]ARQ02635.1 ABC transporter ATP-binding protein [Pseudorhodoplanes sinuspersici]
MMTATRDLDVVNLSAGYDRADVLTEMNVSAKAGSVTCILGANGAGKSTLIRSILGLCRVSSGTVRFGSDVISDMPTHRIAALGIATIPEGNRVFPRMTVLENLRVGGLLVRDAARERKRLDELFNIFPRLEERRNQLAGTLSGGERSMLSIARGLMTDPEFVIFDEPSLGLSPLFVGEVFKIVRRLKESGVTILLVEQNVRQTLDVADYGYLLSQGRVVTAGPTETLKNDPELHKAYFGVH